MNLMLALLLAASAAAPAAPKPAAALSKADLRKKQAAAASIEGRRAELVALADQVWGFAETALRETRSATLLADYAEKQGFRVERGLAGMPTAFVASYGEGRPVIAVLGEYDALPGLSQKAVAERSPLLAGAPGHGCGHNLFGAASLGAAIAVKELIGAGRLSGHRALLRHARGGGGRRQGVHGARRRLQGRRRRARLAPGGPHARRHAGRAGDRGPGGRVQGPGRARRCGSLERPQRRRRGGALHARRQHDARARAARRHACTTRSPPAATCRTSCPRPAASGSGLAISTAPCSTACVAWLRQRRRGRGARRRSRGQGHGAGGRPRDPDQRDGHPAPRRQPPLAGPDRVHGGGRGLRARAADRVGRRAARHGDGDRFARGAGARGRIDRRRAT